MSLFAAASQALPALLGGSGGSTRVSSTNSQSFTGSLDPVFNISLGGGIESSPSRSQSASSPAASNAGGEEETPSTLDALFGAPEYKVYDTVGPAYSSPISTGLDTNMLMIAALGIGAFMLLKGG